MVQVACGDKHTSLKYYIKITSVKYLIVQVPGSEITRAQGPMLQNFLRS
jgi:hypothetical protein